MPDMGVGHGGLGDIRQPLVGLPLGHQAGLVEPVEGEMRLAAQPPQLRPGKTAHGPQRARAGHHIGVAGGVLGAHVGHSALPVRPAHLGGWPEHGGAAAVAAKLAGARVDIALLPILFHYHEYR